MGDAEPVAAHCAMVIFMSGVIPLLRKDDVDDPRVPDGYDANPDRLPRM